MFWVMFRKGTRKDEPLFWFYCLEVWEDVCRYVQKQTGLLSLQLAGEASTKVVQLKAFRLGLCKSHS